MKGLQISRESLCIKNFRKFQKVKNILNLIIKG